MALPKILQKLTGQSKDTSNESETIPVLSAPPVPPEQRKGLWVGGVQISNGREQISREEIDRRVSLGLANVLGPALAKHGPPPPLSRQPTGPGARPSAEETPQKSQPPSDEPKAPS